MFERSGDAIPNYRGSFGLKNDVDKPAIIRELASQSVRLPLWRQCVLSGGQCISTKHDQLLHTE